LEPLLTWYGIDWVYQQELHCQHTVESERHRRNNLRDGFARLKNILPISDEKSSKLGLLERAADHVRFLQDMLHQTQERLIASEMEVARLRKLSEAVVRTG
ncbi:hypothetical protein FRC06_010766, partial [Ceratobasidium sp. 370]